MKCHNCQCELTPTNNACVSDNPTCNDCFDYLQARAARALKKAGYQPPKARIKCPWEN